MTKKARPTPSSLPRIRAVAGRTARRRLLLFVDANRRDQLEVRHTSLAVAPKESSQRATRSRYAIQRLARRTSSGAPRPLLRPTRRLHIHPRSRHPADRRSFCWHRARQATSRSTETSPPNSVSKINYWTMAAAWLTRMSGVDQHRRSGRHPTRNAGRRSPCRRGQKNKPCGAPPLSDAIPAAPADRHPSGSGMRLSTASANHSLKQILQPELNSIRQRMIHRIVRIGRHM